MKTLPSCPGLLLVAVVCCLPIIALSAKPARNSKPTPTPTPSPASSPTPTAESAPDPLARWLVQQNGGKDAIRLSLAEAIHAATGKNVVPIDPANPADAAVIAKLGSVLDRVLPGMNKPESSAHVVSRMDEVTAFFEDAVRAFAATAPGMSCPAASGDAAATTQTAGSFPDVRVLDAASGKSYYLGVALYPTGGREAAVQALRFDPVDAAARFTDDGSCLLVAVEDNGKTGKDIAFLNWELIDLTKLPVRVVTTFTATQQDAHPPGAVLNDGRKGRD